MPDRREQLIEVFEDTRRYYKENVLKGNLPASRLYTRLGFSYVDTIAMFYEDTGWADYEVYEYEL